MEDKKKWQLIARQFKQQKDQKCKT